MTIDEKLDRLTEKIDQMDARFDRMDERFDRMDERFDRMDERMDKMDECFNRMDERMNQMQETLEVHDIRFSTEIEAVHKEVQEVYRKLDKRIERVELSLKSEVYSNILLLEKGQQMLNEKFSSAIKLRDDYLFCQMHTNTLGSRVDGLELDVLELQKMQGLQKSAV